MLLVLSARSLLEMSTWEYQRYDNTLLEHEDDVIVTQEVLRLFIGSLCASEAVDATVGLHSPSDPPAPGIV